MCGSIWQVPVFTGNYIIIHEFIRVKLSHINLVVTKEVTNISICLLLPGAVGDNTDIEISVKAGVTKQRKRRNSKRIGDRFRDDLFLRRVTEQIIYGIVG